MRMMDFRRWTSSDVDLDLHACVCVCVSCYRLALLVLETLGFALVALLATLGMPANFVEGLDG